MDYINRVFEHEILAAAAVVRDARFLQCTFALCGHIPSEFAHIERTKFERTKVQMRNIGALVLREVEIDTCKKNPMLVVDNCLFDRVTMKGEFGSWMFGWFPEFLSPQQIKYAAEFYKNVEWALDIREAHFKELTLRGVPGDKVRRDPIRHGLVRKDRLLSDRSWEIYDKGLVAVLRATLDRPEESEILAVSDFSKDFEFKVKRLAVLREAGFVE